MTTTDTLEVPTVTVAICTRNRAPLLREAIASLARLETEGECCYDILVVDNNSTDNTHEIVQDAQRAYDLTVRYIAEPMNGVAFARNRAVEACAAEWLAFFDDDQVADPRWLLELVRAARRHGVLLTGGAVKLRLPRGRQPELGRFCRDLLSETVGEPVPRRYDYHFKPGAGNLLMHRSLFDHVGRFHADFNDRGEDTYLFLDVLQAGYESWYTPKAVVHHVIPAERLTEAAIVDLTRRLSAQMPHFERRRWGAWFPFAWMARVLHAAVWVGPTSGWARWRGNAEQRIDARCRWLMTRLRILHGAQLLFSGSRRPSPVTPADRRPPTSTAVEAGVDG